MSSVRRTKNFALDGQTPMFLYSILKQLDLRSIDWNLVAESLDISNGHAARMRYSRMRTQFEAMSKEAKPPKPKKDNEAKAAKEKAAKGKRALLEEETERLGTEKHGVRSSGQENTHKRSKMGHQYNNTPWVSSVMPGQQYTNSYWSHPHPSTLKAEPMTEHGSSVMTAPFIKMDPELSETFNGNNGNPETHIKQEQTVKEEPNTNDDVLQELPPVMPSTEENNELAAIAMKQDPSSYPTTYYYPTYRYGTVPGAFQPQNAAGYYQTNPMPAGHPTYPMQQTYAYNPWIGPRQSINPWTQSAMAAQIAPPTAVTTAALSENMVDNSISLDPHASSYEDLLNMPLYTGTPHNFQFDVTTPELVVEDQNVTEALVSAPAQATVAAEQPATSMSKESQPEKEKTKSSSPPVLDLSSDTVPEQTIQQNVIENDLSGEQPQNTTEVTLASGVDTDAQVPPPGLLVAGDKANVDNEADAEHDVDDEQQAITTPVVVETEKESKLVVINSDAGTIEVDKPKVVVKSEPVEILDP